MTLKELLIETRLEMNLTQQELADMLKVDLKTIQFLEYGDPLWNTNLLQKKVRHIKRDCTR